jgi:hypothetical protein
MLIFYISLEVSSVFLFALLVDKLRILFFDKIENVVISKIVGIMSIWKGLEI